MNSAEVIDRYYPDMSPDIKVQIVDILRMACHEPHYPASGDGIGIRGFLWRVNRRRKPNRNGWYLSGDTAHNLTVGDVIAVTLDHKRVIGYAVVSSLSAGPYVVGAIDRTLYTPDMSTRYGFSPSGYHHEKDGSHITRYEVLEAAITDFPSQQNTPVIFGEIDDRHDRVRRTTRTLREAARAHTAG